MQPPSLNVYQYVSEGVFRQSQLIANTNIRAGTKLQLFGYYVLNYANSDTGGLQSSSGASSFASNSYNISQDYGRAAFDTRQRLFVGGSIGAPYGIRLSPFMIASSGGPPFNITSPTDLNKDSIFNDRPSFAPASSCGLTNIYCTALGDFNAAPTASDRPIPINYGTGPTHVTLNMRLSKTFGIGPELKAGATNQAGPRGDGGGHRGGPLFGGGGPMIFGGTSDRRYNFTLSASARNIFKETQTWRARVACWDRHSSTSSTPFRVARSPRVWPFAALTCRQVSASDAAVSAQRR